MSPPKTHSAPGVKQQLAAVRMLFDWLITGQVVPVNPASAVRGPKHVVKVGKTPVLDGKDDGAGRGPKYINYRDLSVQQLGSVYERILDFGLRSTPGGGVEIDADDEARHKSGSYYTPEELV